MKPSGSSSLLFLTGVLLMLIVRFAGHTTAVIVVAVAACMGLGVPIFKGSKAVGGFRRPTILSLGKPGLAIVLTLGMFATLTEVKDHMSRKLGLFQQAMAVVENSGAAQQFFGDDLVVKWPIKPVGMLENGDGKTHLLIPVTGKSRGGYISVDGNCTAGRWTIVSLKVQSSDHEDRITVI